MLIPCRPYRDSVVGVVVEIAPGWNYRPLLALRHHLIHATGVMNSCATGGPCFERVRHDPRLELCQCSRPFTLLLYSSAGDSRHEPDMAVIDTASKHRAMVEVPRAGKGCN